jgi:hypothetical protein
MANVRIWRNFSALRQKMISNVNVENKKRDPIVFLLPWPIYFLRLRLKRRTTQRSGAGVAQAYADPTHAKFGRLQLSQ